MWRAWVLLTGEHIIMMAPLVPLLGVLSEYKSATWLLVPVLIGGVPACGSAYLWRVTAGTNDLDASNTNMRLFRASIMLSFVTNATTTLLTFYKFWSVPMAELAMLTH